MKTFKVAMTLAFATAAVVLSSIAGQAVLSPRAAANAPRVVTDTRQTAPTATSSASGNMHCGSTAPQNANTTSTDAKTHCKAKKGEGRMSCCN
ncbi:MAG: hypothetical protein J0M24_00175 [Verrucomicrobia bacterium]|jgi:hypothetical protein|nr:hypothetical protein [Verrucomicrobiota bacterium]